MKIRTFLIGCILAVTVLLFAHRHAGAAQPLGFTSVVDLTHALSAQVPTFEIGAKSPYQVKIVATVAKDHYFAREFSVPEHFGTHLDAPAHFVEGLWTVDQIPPARLVSPLVVIDVIAKADANADYQIAVEDIAAWEQLHGEIPPNAVVIANTGWNSRWTSVKDYRNADGKGVMHFPGYSKEAAKFLVEARNVNGIGIDTLSIDYGPSPDFPVHQYTMAHSIYHLENVANLEHVPVSGAIVVAAPIKLEGGSGGPVRILALVK
ncbi:MAG TPA: cyclase family protein [Terriglobales bacterium]|jgi:kynurenine formamidase|nr:cyclase family protein [Terriglobales bacterium]